MTTSPTARFVSRRTALAGLGASGLGLALAATAQPAAAQDSATEMAKHPIVGGWKGINDPSTRSPRPMPSSTPRAPTSR